MNKLRDLVREMRGEVAGKTTPIMHEASTLHWAERLDKCLIGDERTPLTIGVEGEEFVIRIGVLTLTQAAERSDHFTTYDPAIQDFRLAFQARDERTFANALSGYLQSEIAEDGTTPLTQLLDNAFLSLSEDGTVVSEVFKLHKLKE